MKKTWYTLFLFANNVHLYKDVGMLPYVVNKKYNMDSYLVCYENQNFTKDLENVRKIFIKRWTRCHSLNCLFYLIKNAKKMDYFNLYHLTIPSLLSIVIYKLVNKSGYVYLKFDTNIDVAKRVSKNKIRKKITEYCLRKADVLSCETNDVKIWFEDNYHLKLIHIPNGVLAESIGCNSIKEKTIMTVGRLGVYPKNTEMLVRAFEKSISYISKEWKLLLVGSTTKEFKDYVNEYIKNQENLKDRIIFLGEIENREEIEKIYEKNIVFSMPSIFEGFSLAAIEAVSKMNYLITSELQCFKEVTDDWKYGVSFDINDIEDYSRKIVGVCSMVDRGQSLFNGEEMLQFVRSNYAWESIVEKIFSGF